MHKLKTGLDDIIELVAEYFYGLHQGDVDLLAAVFDTKASLQTSGVRLGRDQWLENVSSRLAPFDQGHPFKYEVLDVLKTHDSAVVKVSVPLLGKNYIDYLSCLKENSKWTIVNKLYTEVS